jgi:hypothetical protein
MRARFIGLHSADVGDLENWSPGTHFGVLAMVFISPPDGCGEETFYVTVCSPSWFAERMAQDEIRSGYHTIFMHEYNYPKLHAFVERAVQRIEAPTWQELVKQLSWLGELG